jgi:hypothetical protein
MDDAEAVEALVALLNDKDQEIRKAAIQSLACREDDPRAHEVLIGLLKDDNKDTRWMVMKSLSNKQVKDFLENNIKYVYDHYNELIEKGIMGTEPALVRALNNYGGEEMAVIYLNSGSQKLEDGARQWADIHGYTVYQTHSGGGGAKWGSKR